MCLRFRRAGLIFPCARTRLWTEKSGCAPGNSRNYMFFSIPTIIVCSVASVTLSEKKEFLHIVLTLPVSMWEVWSRARFVFCPRRENTVFRATASCGDIDGRSPQSVSFCKFGQRELGGGSGPLLFGVFLPVVLWP